MTKQIRISEKVHTKLKIHVAKNKESIIDFVNRAITTAIADYNMFKPMTSNRENFKKILHPAQSPTNTAKK